jgi:uncharacterized membrane protein YdjX (TVP38/TMEM64 family)
VKKNPQQKSNYLKAAIFAAAIVLVVAISWILPVREFTVALAERLRGAGAKGVVIFLAVYVIAEVALIPGSLLTMVAGFAYGPIGGLLVASPASVLAATVAFLLGRTVLRDWVRKTIAASPTLGAIDRAIGKNSLKLILLLRLSPLIPFNVLNYALGLSDANLGRYVVASLVGMLPGTFLYGLSWVACHHSRRARRRRPWRRTTTSRPHNRGTRRDGRGRRACHARGAASAGGRTESVT